MKKLWLVGGLAALIFALWPKKAKAEVPPVIPPDEEPPYIPPYVPPYVPPYEPPYVPPYVPPVAISGKIRSVSIVLERPEINENSIMGWRVTVQNTCQRDYVATVRMTEYLGGELSSLIKAGQSLEFQYDESTGPPYYRPVTLGRVDEFNYGTVGYSGLVIELEAEGKLLDKAHSGPAYAKAPSYFNYIPAG